VLFDFRWKVEFFVESVKIAAVSCFLIRSIRSDRDSCCKTRKIARDVECTDGFLNSRLRYEVFVLAFLIFSVRSTSRCRSRGSLLKLLKLL
jgi:hypothetical protein